MGDAEMVVLDGGIVAPIGSFELAQSGGRGRFDSGVYNSAAEVCHHGLQTKQSYDNIPAPLDLSSVGPAVPGRHVFGGLMQTGHFGHFIAESLTRLWALREVRQPDSVVFYARRNGAAMPGYASHVFRLLEIDAPVALVERPTAFDRLIVPRQVARAGNAFIWGNAPTRELLAPLGRIAPAPHARVYVSRAGLGPSGGGFLLEEEIERRFEAQGYFVFRPETASLEEQFSVYNGAQQLVFADGSAVHVYAFVAREDQDVAIIWRRDPSEFFLQQVTSFAGRRPMGVSAIVRNWQPGASFGAATRSKSEVSLAVAFDKLESGGFVEGERWADLPASEVAQELERISTATGWEYQA